MSSIIFSGTGPLGPTSSRNLQGLLQVIYDLFKSKEEAEAKCRELSSRTRIIDCKVVDCLKEKYIILRIDPDILDLIDMGYRFAVIISLPKTPY